MTTSINQATYDRAYSDGLYDVASVYDHIIRIRQRYLNFPKGAKLLDHGFGNGVISAYFAREGFDVHGVETSFAAIRLVRSRAAQLGLKADQFGPVDQGIIGLPFSSGTVDCVVSNQVLYFMPKVEIYRTLAEFREIMKWGGKLVATIMHPDNYYFTKFGTPKGDGMWDVKVRGRIERDFELYRFKDEDERREMFTGLYKVDDIGYFDFKLLDTECAKHWIVLARKD